MRRVNFKAWLCVSLALGWVSCADPSPPQVNPAGGDCRADQDCPAGASCVEGECVLVDGGDLGGDAGDVGGDVGGDAGQDLAEDLTDPEPQIGDPCDDGDDCPSGYCIEVGDNTGRKVCTDFCVEGSCPEGYTCAPVANSGADRVFLCFPETDFLCEACTQDADCGGLSDLCLEYSDGRFCGRSCEAAECPTGYECLEVVRDDRTRLQCRNAQNYCSSCLDEDGDGYGGGECAGADCDETNDQIHEGAAERCDGIDNDCDEAIDEDFDTQSDPAHCGGCGIACDFDGAEPRCVEAACALGPCRPDRYDLDGRADNGCEYFCERSNGGEEACDGADNDCDGELDEGFDFLSDPDHCGGCGRACAFPNAVAACVEGDCAIAACDELRYDIDRDPANGCEYTCVITNNGVEACDNIDNNCDGAIDEDFDLDSDERHCGRCGNQCDEAPNAQIGCLEGVCRIADCALDRLDCNGSALDGCEADRLSPQTCLSCDNACAYTNGVAGCAEQGCALTGCNPGWYNVDGDPANGCEYACTPTQGGVEVCDGVDNDCDGGVDEGFDLASDEQNCGRCGVSCGAPQGAEVACVDGGCALLGCAPDRLDCDRLYATGCEADRLGVNSCLACGNVCAFLNGVAGCDEQGCYLVGCNAGYYDLDRDGGCEYACTPSNDGVEVCDNRDNNCDGAVDEGVDTTSDLNHCGGCGRVCQGPPRRQLACANSQCVVGACAPGYYDLNGRSDDGCEYACTPSNNGVEVCDGADNDCDGGVDEGVLNACGQCGAVPAEVCDGIDNNCDGTVDNGTVCGPYIQGRCRLFAAWADRRAGPLGASTTWDVCPTLDRDNTGDLRCVGTRRDGNFARLQLLGNVNTDDQMAVALFCDDSSNPGLASYIQSHCAAFLGHADNNLGVDNSPTWGPCPAAASGDDGNRRCTSSGYDGRFRAVELEGDVDENDYLGIAWICRDPNDPNRAAALTSAAAIFLGWADENRGPADGSASWWTCPGQLSGSGNDIRCVGTQGDGRFRRLLLGGDVDDNDQLGWSLRSR
jgi:hypothetical protein